jgi:hypothetical protein
MHALNRVPCPSALRDRLRWAPNTYGRAGEQSLALFRKCLAGVGDRFSSTRFHKRNASSVFQRRASV